MRDEATTSLPHSFFSGVKYEHLVAGLSGGVISTVATHPFDLIKLRFAGETSHNMSSLKKILHDEIFIYAYTCIFVQFMMVQR